MVQGSQQRYSHQRIYQRRYSQTRYSHLRVYQRLYYQQRHSHQRVMTTTVLSCVPRAATAPPTNSA